MNSPAIELVQANAIKRLKEVAEICQELELQASSVVVTDALSSIQSYPHLVTYQSLRDQAANIKRLLEIELSKKALFSVPVNKIRFLPTISAPHPLGETVARCFPSAMPDMHEAAICMALGRTIASIFHLMRALEFPLGVLAAKFNVPFSHSNWHNVLEALESKIRLMHQDPAWKSMPDFKHQQEFYSQCTSYFMVLKDSWRNYTVHARGRYTDQEAELIFDNVGAFLKRLSRQLSETPQ